MQLICGAARGCLVLPLQRAKEWMDGRWGAQATAEGSFELLVFQFQGWRGREGLERQGGGPAADASETRQCNLPIGCSGVKDGQQGGVAWAAVNRHWALERCPCACASRTSAQASGQVDLRFWWMSGQRLQSADIRELRGCNCAGPSAMVVSARVLADRQAYTLQKMAACLMPSPP
jgi:hypothetical protein